MNKQNIEQIIRDLFRQNFTYYPHDYSGTIVVAIDAAKVTAKGFWDVRTEDEEQRDQEADVTLQDYENWVVAELTNLIPPTSNKFQTWASEINKDWGHNDYKAIAEEYSVIVHYKSEEAARLDYNNANGRYTVSGADKDAVEQLEWFLNR